MDLPSLDYPQSTAGLIYVGVCELYATRGERRRGIIHVLVQYHDKNFDKVQNMSSV